MLMTFKFYLQLSFWLIHPTFDFLPQLAPSIVFLISERRIISQLGAQATNLVCLQLLPFLYLPPSIHQRMMVTLLPCYHDPPLLLNPFSMAAMTKCLTWMLDTHKYVVLQKSEIKGSLWNAWGESLLACSSLLWWPWPSLDCVSPFYTSVITTWSCPQESLYLCPNFLWGLRSYRIRPTSSVWPHLITSVKILFSNKITLIGASG